MEKMITGTCLGHSHINCKGFTRNISKCECPCHTNNIFCNECKKSFINAFGLYTHIGQMHKRRQSRLS